MSNAAVNVDNFAQAETGRMFAAVQAQAGVNQWLHYRAPTPIDRQTVIRMNRDTLYSAALPPSTVRSAPRTRWTRCIT